MALIKRMHDKQRKIDGIGWVDPDQKDRTGKPRIVPLHGCARATFNTWAKDARGYGHKAFPRDLRESCLDHRNESYQCAYDREQALGICERCLMLGESFASLRLNKACLVV